MNSYVKVSITGAGTLCAHNLKRTCFYCFTWWLR